MALRARPAKLGVVGYGVGGRYFHTRFVEAAEAVSVPSEQGRYHDLYTAFDTAIRGEGRQPVPASDAVRTLVVLDAARLSAERGSSVEVSTPALHA